MCILAIPSAVHSQSTQQPATQQPAAQQPAAQPASSSEGDTKLPVSLDRIREGLQHESKLRMDFLDPSIPLFRVAVQEKGLKLSDYWKVAPDTAVSRDVRPPFASTWHNEFLRMTTPQQQIGASAFGIFGNPQYPVGPPVLAITSALKKGVSNMERSRIRAQIQEELKEIDANNARQTPESQEAQDAQQTPPATPAAPTPATAPRNPGDPR